MSRASDFACAVCGKGPRDGVSVYRMNAKGQPGLWSCDGCGDAFDGIAPADVVEIVETLEG